MRMRWDGRGSQTRKEAPFRPTSISMASLAGWGSPDVPRVAVLGVPLIRVFGVSLPAILRTVSSCFFGSIP